MPKRYFAYAQKAFCVGPQGVLRRPKRLPTRFSAPASTALEPPPNGACPPSERRLNPVRTYLAPRPNGAESPSIRNKKPEQTMKKLICSGVRGYYLPLFQEEPLQL